MNIKEVYEKADWNEVRGALFNSDCLDLMKMMDNDSVDLLLTDIPYNAVNREDNGLRSLNKGKADIMAFDLQEFLKECYRVTKGTVIIFCDFRQMSPIFFSSMNTERRKLVQFVN